MRWRIPSDPVTRGRLCAAARAAQQPGRRLRYGRILSAVARLLVLATLALSLTSCATGPSAPRASDDREFLRFDDSRFAALYAAQDWNGAAARVEELTRAYQPVVTSFDATNAWKMLEACERAQKLDAAAIVCSIDTPRRSDGFRR